MVGEPTMEVGWPVRRRAQALSSDGPSWEAGKRQGPGKVGVMVSV